MSSIKLSTFFRRFMAARWENTEMEMGMGRGMGHLGGLPIGIGILRKFISRSPKYSYIYMNTMNTIRDKWGFSLKSMLHQGVFIWYIFGWWYQGLAHVSSYLITAVSCDKTNVFKQSHIFVVNINNSSQAIGRHCLVLSVESIYKSRVIHPSVVIVNCSLYYRQLL